MSHPNPSPAAGASVPTCGACGARVSNTDVICPACGVLLAAYQAPAGATGVDTSATRAVPSPAMSTPPAPPPIDTDQGPPPPPEPAAPRHRPRSQSPIGDALRHSRETPDAEAGALGSEAIADELARMATSDSALAREVEAELSGARVTFDGAKPVIETEPVEISHPAAGAPLVSAPAPASPAPKANRPVAERVAPATPGPAARSRPPSRSAAASAAPGTPGPSPQMTRPAVAGFDPATLSRWLPFVLIGCAVLAIGRSLAGVGALLGIVLVIGLVYLLVKVASVSSRKTTSMPRDESWKTKPPRPRK